MQAAGKPKQPGAQGVQARTCTAAVPQHTPWVTLWRSGAVSGQMRGRPSAVAAAAGRPQARRAQGPCSGAPVPGSCPSSAPAEQSRPRGVATTPQLSRCMAGPRRQTQRVAAVFVLSALAWDVTALLVPARLAVLRGGSASRPRCRRGPAQWRMSSKTAADERSERVIAAALERDPDVSACAHPLQRRRIDYRDGSVALQGMAVWPDAVRLLRSSGTCVHACVCGCLRVIWFAAGPWQDTADKLPGVLVVHTAVGLQEDFMDYILR